MRYQEFALERWLGQGREIDLASAGISRLRLSEVCEGFDTEMLLSYGATCGSDQIRNEIAGLYPGVNASGVLVTTGAAEASFLALYRLLEPGDEVVTLRPTYMQQQGIAESLRAHVHVCELREEDGYKVDPDRVADAITNRTKVVCLVNPQNPTGQIIGHDELLRICQRADQVGAWVLCDGALRGTEVDGELAATPIGMLDRALATGSVSKIGMAGVRIGWLVGNTALVQECWDLKDYTTLSHSGIGEVIVTQGLTSEHLDRFFARARARVRENVEVVDRVINESEGLLRWVKPIAGHTGFPAYAMPLGSVELCSRLLAEEGVLLSPGDFFGQPGHVRLRYSGERGELDEGLRRVLRFLKRNSGEFSPGLIHERSASRLS